MDDIWLARGFDDAEKTLTEYRTFPDINFPTAFHSMTKGWSIERMAFAMSMSMRLSRQYSYFITYMRTRNLYFTNGIGGRPA